VDYPPNFAVTTIKKDATVDELKVHAEKVLKLKEKLTDYQVVAVGYLSDVIPLENKGKSKLGDLGVEDKSVVFLLAPENLKPTLKGRRKKVEEDKDKEEEDPDERYKGLTVDNAIKSFETARNKKSKEIAMEYIEMHAKEILAKAEKLKLDTLKLILKSDFLNIPEGAILDTLVKWAKNDLKKQKESSKTVKQHLEETGLFSLIRFPSFELSDVASKVTPSGLLSEQQLLDLFTYLSGKAGGLKPTLPSSLKTFNIKPREPREECDTSWMQTDDHFKGFRPLASPSGTTRFWLCVSKENTFDQKKKYDPPKGYEWASSDMWNSNTVLSNHSEYNYYNQGGWSSYTWNGTLRHCFCFKDTVSSKRIIHAGNYATMGGFQTWDPVSPSNSYYFAGIVVYKKGTYDHNRKMFKV